MMLASTNAGLSTDYVLAVATMFVEPLSLLAKYIHNQKGALNISQALACLVSFVRERYREVNSGPRLLARSRRLSCLACRARNVSALLLLPLSASARSPLCERRQAHIHRDGLPGPVWSATACRLCAAHDCHSVRHSVGILLHSLPTNNRAWITPGHWETGMGDCIPGRSIFREHRRIWVASRCATETERYRRTDSNTLVREAATYKTHRPGCSAIGSVEPAAATSGGPKRDHRRPLHVPAKARRCLHAENSLGGGMAQRRSMGPGRA